jgi:hypothetical protein
MSVWFTECTTAGGLSVILDDGVYYWMIVLLDD